MSWSMVRHQPTTTQPPPLGSAYLSSNQTAFKESRGFGLSPLPPPTTIAGCPRGLEPVIVAEELTIDRLAEYEYIIRTASGQILFSASIDVAFCNFCGLFNLCGDGPAYRLAVEDLEKREVLALSSPETSRYGTLTRCLCLREYDVTAGGLPIGAVTQERGCFRFDAKVVVRSADGDAKLFIMGPDCDWGWCCHCGADVVLPVIGCDGQRVGSVTKVYRGFRNEARSRTKVYRVQFPPGLDPSTKVTLFGAAFVAGHTFFESSEESTSISNETG